MSLAPVKCTKCGAHVIADSTKETTVCETCGASFAIENTIAKDTDEKSVDSAAYEEFRMEVEDVFKIMLRGIIVTGEIKSGRITVGETVKLPKTGLTATVTGIEQMRKLVNAASAGANVGLQLKGITKKDAAPGDIITK